MTFLGIDPASGERLREHPAWGATRLDRALYHAATLKSGDPRVSLAPLARTVAIASC